MEAKVDVTSNSQTSSERRGRRSRLETRAESVKWLEAARTLNTRTAIAGRDVDVFWSKVIDSSCDIYSGLKDINKSDIARGKWFDGMLSKRQKIALSVTTVKDQLLQPYKAPHWEEDSKRTLNAVGIQIKSIREAQLRDTDLLNSEAAELESELSTLTENISNWGQVAVSRARTPQRSGSSSPVQTSQKEQMLPAEVLSYQNFIQQYGTTGGWDTSEHNEFLRIYSENENDESALIRKVVLKLQKDQPDAFQHLRFYQKYLSLRESNGIAVKRWQAERELNKQRSSSVPQKHVDKVSQSVRIYRDPSISRNDSYRQKQRGALQAWKENRENETNRCRDLMAEVTKARVIREKTERERKREEQKTAIAIYKKEKEMKRANIDRETNHRNSLKEGKVSDEALITLRARDKLILERKMSLVRKVDPNIKKVEREQRLTQLLPTRHDTPRSFDRLTQPTIASQQREVVEDIPQTETILLRGNTYNAPPPVRFAGRSMVAWCGSNHLL